MKRRPTSLADARVLIGGSGRVGSMVAIGSHEAGIGHIESSDPQSFDHEKFLVTAYSRQSDIGKAKVHVVERYLDGRPQLEFVSHVARIQTPSLIPSLKRAHLYVSCPNQLDARLYMNSMSIRFAKICVQAGVNDARNSLGGFVSVWVPGTDSACFACLFPHGVPRRKKGEILLPNVTNLVAAVAVDLVTNILRGIHVPEENNLFMIDAKVPSVTALSVRPRPNCAACSSTQRRKR